MKKIFILVLILAPFLLAGCFESKEEYVLNPDGSGKVNIVGSFETGIPGAPPSTDPNDTPRQVKELLEKSRGVDAWSNITYERTKEGRIGFKGTAYFPNLSELDLETFGKEASFTKSGNNLVLQIEEKEKGDTPQAKLTEDEIKAQINQSKQEWKQMKTIIGPMLEKIKQQLTYKLPSTVESSMNMKKVDSTTVTVQMDGTKLITAMDSMMADDAWLKKQAEAGNLGPGGSGPEIDEEVNARMFGERGPVMAKISVSAAPQFDYQKEVATAKAEHAKFLEKLTKDAE
jgi:hypothetical protein